MIVTAKARLAALVNTVYPTLEPLGRVLHPDDTIGVFDLLRADPAVGVVILHSPVLTVAGPVNTFNCLVSVCAPTENAALASADLLLGALRSRSPIAPTTGLSPIAQPLQEDGYWRVAVGFTLRLKA